MDKKITSIAKDNTGQSNDVACSEFLLAARFGWRFIVGLVLSGVVCSLVYDSIRTPLYEARATIRVGWVPLGSGTLSIESIKDLVAMEKSEYVLLPLFKELGFSDHDNSASQLKEGLSVEVKSPGSNLVEFKLVSSSKENARVWLEKLILIKVAEHAKVLDDFVYFYNKSLDCANCSGLAKNVIGEKLSLAHRSRSGFFGAYPMEPLIGPTIVSESVKVGVARTFPSLQFLIFSSVIGGVFFGAMFSLAFLSPRRLLRVS